MRQRRLKADPIPVTDERTYRAVVTLTIPPIVVTLSPRYFCLVTNLSGSGQDMLVGSVPSDQRLGYFVGSPSMAVKSDLM